MSDYTKHEFEFLLPELPNRTVGQSGMQCKLQMDGKELRGVTGLTVRAGANGFTNVVVEFEAQSAIKAAGALVANMNMHEVEEDYLLGGIFEEAVEHIPVLREFNFDGAEKRDFVKSIIEKTLERVK